MSQFDYLKSDCIGRWVDIFSNLGIDVGDGSQRFGVWNDHPASVPLCLQVWNKFDGIVVVVCVIFGGAVYSDADYGEVVR